MADDKQQRFPQITRNRLLAILAVVAGVVAIAILQPDLVIELFKFLKE